MPNYYCPKCGAEIADRNTLEDAQFDHDLYEVNCDGQVKPL